MVQGDVLEAVSAAFQQVDVGRWRELMARVEARDYPDLRRCGMAYHVAGILYEEHQAPILSDAAYDDLCRHLLRRFIGVRRAGCSLDEGALRAGTAMGWRDYPKPAHDVAYVLANRRGLLGG